MFWPVTGRACIAYCGEMARDTSKPREPKLTLFAGIAVSLGLGTCVFYYEYRDAGRDWHLAERGVQSYAWVTRVSPRWASTATHRNESKCELEGLLPEQLQNQRPRIGTSGTLVDRAATYFTSVEPDPERNCRDYLHTWQPVLFNPQDRSEARFAFGYRPPLQVLFEWACVLLLLACVYFGFRLFTRR
jgi:hypothetical protein